MGLTTGDVLQNRYRVVSPLGHGGMGAVHRAWDTRLKIPVALKEMTPQPGLEQATLAQLRQQILVRFSPYRIDWDTLDAHTHWAHPLSSADERNLARLRHHPALADVAPLIDHMLLRGIKLEQEAIGL